MRNNNRKNDEIREIKITKEYIKYPEGSVLIELGNTKVICNATVEEKVPPFLKGSSKGWITAEYSMLPRATNTRTKREFSKIAAISVGIVDGEVLLDLEYEEDSKAEVDMNIIMNDKEEFVEIQGTGEGKTFNLKELNALLDITRNAFDKLFSL